jgi:hypothetical protein
MAAQNYAHNIRSIRDIHPELPAMLGTLDLDSGIDAGAPINQTLLTQAHGVVRALKGIQGKMS